MTPTWLSPGRVRCLVSAVLLTVASPAFAQDDLSELRARLVAEQRSNAEQAEAHEATARELAAHTDAESVIERELAEMGAARARAAIWEAEEALGRLAAGTYGTCETCHAPISVERLEAIPQASSHHQGFLRFRRSIIERPRRDIVMIQHSFQHCRAAPKTNSLPQFQMWREPPRPPAIVQS